MKVEGASYDYSDSVFLEKYKRDMIKTIKQINPTWDDDLVEKTLDKLIKKKIQNPTVTLDNNYTGQRQDSTLLTTFDWVLTKNPIIAGNGTFYANQDQKFNPIAQMLDDILIKRKSIKKQMFSVEDTKSKLYNDLDLAQLIQKILANSYYGGAGMPTSPFYSVWSGPATTCTAQSCISTAYATFEAFIMDNFLFIDVNECFHWLNEVTKEIKSNPGIDDWVIRKDVFDVFEKIKGMFIEWKHHYEEPIMKYLSNLDDDTLTRIYYRNRLMEFTETHAVVKHLHKEIINHVICEPQINPKNPNWESEINPKYIGKFDSANEYNREMGNMAFMNPNSVPDTIKEYIEELSGYYMKYVYTQFMAFDRIYRLKNFGRKTVCVIDTDSNILALDTWVKYIIESIDYDRSIDIENLEFIIINTITFTLTELIQDTLQEYGKKSNVPKEWRKRYVMKNEFFMRRLIIGKAKKRYMSLFKLREGTLLRPAKVDIKGFDFKKATTSDEAEKMFTNLAKEHLLYSDKIDIPTIQRELAKIENIVRESIRNGELTYLPNATAKELAAYKEPESEQSVRGVITWNHLFPDDIIELPTKVKLLKLNMMTEESISPLRSQYPEYYKILMEKIFNDTTGMFVKHKSVNGKPKTQVKGVQVIAIPLNKSIPKWLDPYIDYIGMVNTIMSPFKSVCELLGIHNVSVGKSTNGINRKTDKFTNIVNF